MLCNKRGQIGETMTWVVATIIIIVILAVAIFIVSSSFISEKKINPKDIKTDLLVTKSMSGYLLTDGNFNRLKTEGDFNEENCALAKNIMDLSSSEYKSRWMGIVDSNDEPDKNDCFQAREWLVVDEIKAGDLFIKIKLDENKFLEGNFDEKINVEE